MGDPLPGRGLHQLAQHGSKPIRGSTAGRGKVVLDATLTGRHLDAIELVVAASADGDVKVSVLAELRLRENVIGTTWSARQDMRIRYTKPSSATPASVSKLDNYRDL